MFSRKRFFLNRAALGMVLAALCFMAVLYLPDTASAQQNTVERMTQPGRMALGTSVGIQSGTADGTIFGLTSNLDYYLDRHLSLGPLLQVGISDDFFQLGLSGQAKYVFTSPEMPRLRPHLQGGLGIIGMDLDRPGPGDNDDIGFLIPLGSGIEYAVGKNTFLGTTLLLNFTDADVRGQDNVFMSWVFGQSARL
jgi:hypothetical protein